MEKSRHASRRKTGARHLKPNHSFAVIFVAFTLCAAYPNPNVASAVLSAFAMLGHPLRTKRLNPKLINTVCQVLLPLWLALTEICHRLKVHIVVERKARTG
ncbi:MAG: hypothetical protein N2116_01670 [Armatimonadetes bacterium]|nr:hypothetical protein [Armatimonadota bacterium]